MYDTQTIFWQLFSIANNFLLLYSLTFRYKLYCDANYYSSDCSVYCVASDTDADGHYTCDPTTGNIVCRPGKPLLSDRISLH